MTIRRYILLLTGILLLSWNGIAQTNDTLDFYKKIKKIAYKHKPTILLYHAIFVEPAPKEYVKKPLSDQQKTTDPNLKYECSIIRNIKILVYDPFGYNVNDTTVKTLNPFQKLGNRYHVATRNRIIRNMLLFKQHEPLEMLVINESERIIRSTGYINDARIYIEAIEGTVDSVDITVVASDKWTLDAYVSGSMRGGHITLREKNILGSGQLYSQYLGYDIPSTNYEYRGTYNVQNIKNSFISSSFFYTTTKDITLIGGSFDRPFYSAIAKWAGGVAASKTWGTYTKTDTLEKTIEKFRLDYINTDVWLARNINPGTGKRINRRNINIVVTARYIDNRYQSRPSFSIDTGKTNLNSTFYLSSLGFSLRKYYKDQYIYRFGANEDVPEGVVIQALYGILYKELNSPKYYSGFELSKGKHYEKLGYFSGGLVFGAFYNHQGYINAAANLGLYYFSDLLEKNKWYFRQFINYKFIYGYNKTSGETITLRSDEMYGFNPGTLKGNKKMILNLETVSYAPYNIIGFRFAPLLLMACGLLESQPVKLSKSPLYQSYALGLLIRNENLLNASFEITYGFYPNLPDGNNKFYKFNPVTSFTLKVRSFAVSKPTTVSFD